jgi:hypothetical protein
VGSGATASSLSAFYLYLGRGAQFQGSSSFQGIGNLSVSAGGQANASTIYVGSTGGVGHLTVDGAGSVLDPTSSAYLYDGYSTSQNGSTTALSTGTVYITNGGVANLFSADIGDLSGTGQLTIAKQDGTDIGGSLVNASNGSIDVGTSSGNGTVTVNSGGTLLSATVTVGSSGGTGLLTVKSGGNLTNSGSVYIGNAFVGPSANPGSGAFNISAGTATVSGTTHVYASGKLNLTGGNLTTGNLQIDSASSLNWTSGTVHLTVGSLTVGNNSFSSSNLAVQFGISGNHLPAEVLGLPGGVSAVATGASYALAIQNGGVYAWGDNTYGELGNETYNSSSTPLAVTGLTSGVTAIAAGEQHSVAIQNGGVYAWGYNADGELGNGNFNGSNTPVAVTGLSSAVTSIAAGAFHNLAIRNGGVYAWGDNVNGQLGNGTNSSSNTPVTVSGLSSGVTAVAAGLAHSLAILQDGSVVAWGYNQYGQLGNGTTNSSNAPVAVSGLSNGVTAIAAGFYHSLAIQKGGVFAWGDNGYGELGNGTFTNSSVPIHVDPTDLTNITAVAGGNFTSYALGSDGSLWGWGENNNGQLGLGTNTPYYLTPQHVLPPVGYVYTSVSANSIGTQAVATLAPVQTSGGAALLTLNPGQLLQITDAGQSLNVTGAINLSGGGLSVPTINQTAGTFRDSGTLTLAGTGGNAVSYNLSGGTCTLVALSVGSGGKFNWTGGNLQLTGGGSTFGGPLTIPATGQLIVDGMVDLPGGNLATTWNQIQQGYNAGTWQGSGGITSAAAAADASHITALAVIQNSTNQSASGPVLYTSLDGYPFMTAGDVLLKRTYYGDANLDGRVASSDYTLIDNGYLLHLTGWYNGDFNYDGVINGSDYTLIDNAFNQQGAQLTTEIASAEAQIAGGPTSAVPEPTGVLFAALAGAGLLRRRRVGAAKCSC